MCISDKKEGEQRGREVPGPSKKITGLLDIFSPRDFWVPGPSGSVGPIPSRDLPGTSRDGTVLLESLLHTTGTFHSAYLKNFKFKMISELKVNIKAERHWKGNVKILNCMY
jgi:hypothetical protein